MAADSDTAGRVAPARARAPRRRAGKRNIVAYVVLTLGSVVMVLPFAWQIILSLSTSAQAASMPPTFWPGTLRWHNFADVFSTLPFFRQFGVSVLITVIRVGAQLILCSMAGYAFARMYFPLRNTLFGSTLALMMVPPAVLLISQYQIVLKLNLVNTIAGIVAPGLFSAFGTFMMRQFFLSLPNELDEAARLDGCNEFQVFARVMLPLAAPGLSALAVIGVLFSWNDLLWPLIVTTRADAQPLSVGLTSLQGSTANTPIVMAASLMASAPILLLFIALQRRVIDGLASSGLK